ncbi:MAG: DNA mismatch repair endonuclease MutL [Nitrospinae bacterium]|nr:DNA mismatch repair endonuclease MutL [Nitrospinota bacterium]
MRKQSRIRILPESLANQIAAGEVVQRPASALKELVENSIDAGASRVEIDLASGGAARVQVVDDGHGMSEDDALLSLERHATSKIASDWDLGRVATLGFRGEALPSVAAVSKMTITTRRSEDALGTEVRIEGGKLQRVTEMGATPGTRVEVRSLFFNVPARRKFLKRRETELARCLEVANQAAMANPNVSFVLRHGKRTLLDLDASGGLQARAAQLVGEAAVSQLLKIPRAASENMTFSGWAGAPGLNRSTRDAQYLFVNGRPIRDRLFVHAAYAAYRSFMPVKRHPVFILFLDMPPEDVDVNVHPAKQEVRFRFASNVYDLVRESVAAVLGARPERVRRDFAHQEVSHAAPGAAAEESAAPALLGGGGYFGNADAAGDYGASEEGGSLAASPLAPDAEAADTDLPAPASSPSESAAPSPLERTLEPPHPSDPVVLSECRYLGQWEECFLLFASPQGLVLVDQHAAHERVLYNRFRDQFREGRVDSQACLVPEEIRLRPEEALGIEAHRDDLLRSGFELECAGPGDYRIRAVPALLADRDPAGAVRQIVEGLADLEQPVSFADLIDGIITRMSCRGAVKAAQAMRPEEVAALVEELEKTPGRWTCPHGRPIMLVMSPAPVRRRFLRS